MKTKAVRLYGKKDLRLEEFELPPVRDDEILAQVVSDSICMSSYKATTQGSDHKRIPKDISSHPVIIGHEFCGRIVEAGAKWKNKFSKDDKFTIQPALNLKDDPLKAPGYSYEYIGGDATFIIIPAEVIKQDCLLPYHGEAFFYGSLAEPMSCIVGAFHAQYHTTGGSYIHVMGIRERGAMAILAGAGPMGFGAIDYAVHADRKPRLLVVTDIDAEKLARAAQIHSPAEAAKHGVKLVYINTTESKNPKADLLGLNDGNGYDDVFVFAPVRPVVELGDSIAGRDCCLNFFAGPTDPAFSAEVNFYNMHYSAVHIAATSGGNTDDLKESIKLMEKHRIDPAGMITHIGGLDAVADTTLRLPEIRGGKKLIYTNIKLKLTAIADFHKEASGNPLFGELEKLVCANNGLWCKEAEALLLSRAGAI